MADAVPAADAAEVVAPPATEKPAEKPPEAAPPPVDTSKSREFLKLAAQERERNAARKEREAMKQELEALRRETEAQKARRAQYAQNPVMALQDLGLTYEQVTQYLANGGKPTAEMAVTQTNSEVERLRKELESMREQTLERERAEKRREYIGKIQAAAKASEATEYAAVLDPDGVYAEAAAEAIYAETGEIPSPEEVAARVDAGFEELINRAKTSKKFAALLKTLMPKEEKPAEAKKDEKPAEKPTLTKEAVAGSAAKAKAKTEAERRAAALAALEQHFGG